MAGSLWHAGDGFLENLFADRAHFSEDRFQPAMVEDGFLVEMGLFGRESQADGLGFYFSGQPPGVRRLRADAALSDPAEMLELCFELVIALLKTPESAW